MGRRSRELASRRAAGLRRDRHDVIRERNTTALTDDRGRFVGYLVQPGGNAMPYVTTPTGNPSRRYVGPTAERRSGAHQTRITAVESLKDRLDADRKAG